MLKLRLEIKFSKGNSMTDKQKEQFNGMLNTLRRISKDYQTPEQLGKNSEKQYGLEYEEALAMSYDNIQKEAVKSIKNVRIIK